jgi:hypothetical protein
MSDIVYPGGEKTKTEGTEEAAETGRELYISEAYGRRRRVGRSTFLSCFLMPAACHPRSQDPSSPTPITYPARSPGPCCRQ